jgi:hypothetical protein
LGKELGHDLSFIDPIQDLQKRYLAVKHYFNKLGHFQQQSFEGGSECSLSKPWNDSTPICRIGGAEKTCRDWRQTKGSIHFGISPLGKAVKSSLSKKKKSQDKSSTASGQSELHRLQYRERQHSLPRYSGGAVSTYHVLCA